MVRLRTPLDTCCVHTHTHISQIGLRRTNPTWCHSHSARSFTQLHHRSTTPVIDVALFRLVMSEAAAVRPPVPPFTAETAAIKVRAAEDAWNSRDPQRVSLAYTPNSQWRNRSQFLSGRPAIVAFLTGKWQAELHYRLVKELWCAEGSRIAVRFCYEWQDAHSQWWRSYGNEQWQFDAGGLMEQRHASINDVRIEEQERKFRWETPTRPADHPSLTELGL